MAKARFVYTNLALTATITASKELATHPAAFLANPARWKKWRSSPDVNDQWVLFTFSGNQTVKCVALVDYVAHAGGSIIAESYDPMTGYATIGTFTLPSFNPTKVVALWFPSGVTTPRIRITFVNTATVAQAVEMGVCVVGTYYQPTYNVIDGFDLQLIDPSEIVSADGGQESGQERTKYHVFSGDFEAMPEADRDAFMLMWHTNGRVDPVLLAVDPDDADEVLYARLQAVGFEHATRDEWDIKVSAAEAR